ncbi:MAG: hypothetical protein HY060_14365 [Proteobacteria bacterium]|nr:hypothetical protein [Pseudomonadota bacterium]
MPTHFFADAAFLGLLQFWDESRRGRALPAWNGDIEALPVALRPYLVVADGLPDPRYGFIGAEGVRRWGSDATGLPVSDVLPPAYGRYIQSLFDEASTRRAPVFSASIFRQGSDDDLIMTGRLFTPFTRPGADEPAVIINVQLFKGSEQPLSRVTYVHEIRRDLIAIAPALCAKLEEARRYYHAARALGRSLTDEVESMARSLMGSALVSLTPLADQTGK